MINLYYSEAYWGHSQTMNGPHKVVKNLLMSLNKRKLIMQSMKKNIKTIFYFNMIGQVMLNTLN